MTERDLHLLRQANKGQPRDPQEAAFSPPTIRTAQVSEQSKEARDLLAVIHWLSEVAQIDLSEIVADGGITAGMVVQQEARNVQLPRLNKTLEALASPTPSPSLEKLREALEHLVEWADQQGTAVPLSRLMKLTDIVGEARAALDSISSPVERGVSE